LIIAKSNSVGVMGVLKDQRSEEVHMRLKCVALVALLFSSTLAFSATISSNTNWSAISPTPTPADPITVQSGARLTIDVGNAVCNTVQLGVGSGGGNGTILFVSGAKLTVGTTVTLGNNLPPAGTGSIDMSLGGTLTAQSIVDTNPGSFN